MAPDLKNSKQKQSLAKQFGWSFIGFVLVFVVTGFLFNRATNADSTAAVVNSPKPVLQKTVEKPATAPKNIETPSLIRFIALGDSGSGASFQRDVAKQMLDYHQQHPVSMLLHLGDVIYPHGEIDQYGESRYLKYYRPLMNAGIDFKVSLGNHDLVNGFKPAILKFYNMPARYYQFNQGFIDFFALDTNIINDAKQLAWLDKALAKSKQNPAVKWQIVYGHHPVFSTGAHKPELAIYQKKLQPILEKHQVPLYIAGHDHDYERFNAVNGVNYVVSGGGGAYLRPFKHAALPHTKIRKAVHHFTVFEATPAQITMTVIDKTGMVIDEAVYKK